MQTTGPRLGAADTAWWRMEEPSNQMTITGVLTFGAPLEFARLERRVRDRMLPLAPFRCRPRDTGSAWAAALGGGPGLLDPAAPAPGDAPRARGRRRAAGAGEP
jgi:hypothetical protein